MGTAGSNMVDEFIDRKRDVEMQKRIKGKAKKSHPFIAVAQQYVQAIPRVIECLDNLERRKINLQSEEKIRKNNLVEIACLVWCNGEGDEIFNRISLHPTENAARKYVRVHAIERYGRFKANAESLKKDKPQPIYASKGLLSRIKETNEKCMMISIPYYNKLINGNALAYVTRT